MSISENGRTRELSTAALSGSQPYALISLATLCADSIAPCLHPFRRDVCSPAKKIRPSLRSQCEPEIAMPTGLQKQARPLDLPATALGLIPLICHYRCPPKER